MTMKLLAKAREREDTVSDSEEDSDFTNVFHRIAVNNDISSMVSINYLIIAQINQC